jgi:hypothetical protein
MATPTSSSMTPVDHKRSELVADGHRFRRSAFALAILLLLVAGSLVPNAGPALVFDVPPAATLDSWMRHDTERFEIIRRLRQELILEQSARTFSPGARLSRRRAQLQEEQGREGASAD